MTDRERETPDWREEGGGSFGTGFWAGTGGMSRERMSAVVRSPIAKKVALGVVAVFVIVTLATLFLTSLL